MRVIGVDPGSRACGYGVLESANGKIKHLTSGTIIPPQKGSLPERLRAIYKEIVDIIETHSPDCMSIEEVFFAKNAKSALKLGQARGVALLAAANSGMDIYEYAPTSIKLALTGNGRAKKPEVQKMVSYIIGVIEGMSNDSSDALAIAICHINSTRKIGTEGLNLNIRPGRRKRRRFKLDDITSEGKNS